MDDDIIVVEGTPLADYLRSLGFEEEIESIHAEDEQPIKKDQSWKRLCKRVTDMLLPSRASLVRDIYQEVSIDALNQCKVLEEQDIIPILSHRGLTRNITEKDLPWVFLKRALLDAAIVLIPSIAAGFWRGKSLLSVFLVASPAAAILWSWLPAVYASHDYSSLKSYLSSMKTLHEKLRAASRLVNETALINQGYLLTERNGAAAWRLETKSLMAISRLSEKSLPGLRIALIETTSRLAVVYNEELELMRRLRPLPHHLDHPSLSLPPVEDTIVSLKMGENEQSIPELWAIKKAMDIAKLKEREYVRRLLLKMLAEEEDSYSVQIGPKLISSVRNAILELDMAILLNQTLFCNSCEYRPKVTSKPNEYNQGVLYSVCHSSRLHLMESLRGAQSMEDTLQNMDMSPLRSRGTLILLLTKINFHMESAKECLLRASILVDRATCPEGNTSDAVPVRSDQDQFIGGNASEECLLATENLPSDEIFEVIGERVCSEDEDEDVCVGSMKDKTDKENSQMMMRELKNVLRVKAQDWEERENKLRGCVRSVGEEVPKELKPEIDLTSRSSLTVEVGDTNSSLSSWVIPSVGESGNVCNSEASVPKDDAKLDPNLLGSLATQAVAIAKLNQGFGLMCGEEDFITSGDED